MLTGNMQINTLDNIYYCDFKIQCLFGTFMKTLINKNKAFGRSTDSRYLLNVTVFRALSYG